MAVYGAHTKEQFDAALASFYEGCQRITREYFKIMGWEHNPTGGPWRQDHGKKRVRIVREDGVHCFVDYETGDVLKGADWSSPAPHARGNIYDEHNGLGRMKWTGPEYLR